MNPFYVNHDDVVFNGIVFRRYPNAKRWSDRYYFRASSRYIKLGIRYLHREVWKFHFGDIPDGFEVHHKDNNTLNNSIDNLELLSKTDHLEHHSETMPEWRREWLRQNVLTKAQPKAVNWHKSDEGREFHKHLGNLTWENKKPLTLVCEVCGTVFQTVALHSKTRFCSNKCRSKARKQSGVDNVNRPCAYCGKDRIVDKYSKTHYCNSTCAKRHKQAK